MFAVEAVQSLEHGEAVLFVTTCDTAMEAELIAAKCAEVYADFQPLSVSIVPEEMHDPR